MGITASCFDGRKTATLVVGLSVTLVGVSLDMLK
jgi:hypothetical protein